MPTNDEIRRRVPPANREALVIPAGRSIFEAIEDGLPVDAVVYNTRTGEVVIGRSETHQGLINRFAPYMNLDDCVRADIFGRYRRLEMDTMRGAVAVDPRGMPFDRDLAWDNVLDAFEVFVWLGLPDGWGVYIDGQEIVR